LLKILLSKGLSGDQLQEIKDLEEACCEHEKLTMKLNLDMLEARPVNETNDFLYYDDNKLIGFLGLYGFGSHPKEIEATGMVHPSYRCAGIFKELFNAAKQECIARRVEKILLVTEKSSDAGISFANFTSAQYSCSEYRMKFDKSAIPSFPDLDILLRKAEHKDYTELQQLDELCFGLSMAEPEIDNRYNMTWLGYSPEEIKSQLVATGTQSIQDRCLIAVDGGVVCGFLGIYRSEEQLTARLLGPYISIQNRWTEIAVHMLSALKEKVPAHFKLAKVAFYDANVNCKRVYATNHFTLYNAKKTLKLESKDYNSAQPVIHQEINIRDYHPNDMNKFLKIHPTTAYFTGAEVVARLDQYNRLIVAEQGIGSLLINQAVNEAFKHHWVNHIEISVRVNNKDAERLYARAGFKEKNVIIALQRDLNVNPWANFKQPGIYKTGQVGRGQKD